MCNCTGHVVRSIPVDRAPKASPKSVRPKATQPPVAIPVVKTTRIVQPQPQTKAPKPGRQPKTVRVNNER